ncbi:alpha/beta hydrolase [Nonomuraea sp. ZG12]|uniref:alpha/beta hydrolase n=1 Tax=Nonomuraea sp. ZG12 TaxID=3452207 RepID=UPI003F8CCAF5
MSDVLVLVGPGLAADEALLGEIAEREFAALGVRGVITHVRDAADVRARTRPRQGTSPAPIPATTPAGAPGRENGSGHVRTPAAGDGGLARRRGARVQATVIIPGPEEDIRRLMGESLGLVVWLDIWRADGIVVGEGAAHIHGRGLGGLAWAIRHAVHRLRHPYHRISYGPHHEQWADLYLPAEARTGASQEEMSRRKASRERAVPIEAGASEGLVREGEIPSMRVVSPEGVQERVGSSAEAGREVVGALLEGGEVAVPASEGALAPLPVRVPVVVLVHGGYWRSVWAADLMDALGADLVERGFAVWNLEYRRPDLHGWEVATADVAAGLDALASAGAPLDLGRVAVVGHSAGGQLALRAAADGARVSLAVSLAGVLDLVEGDRRWLSSGAVAVALGTVASHMPDIAGGVPGNATSRERSVADGHEVARSVYGAASPMLRLPLGVRQLIVQGSGDDLDLLDFGRRYAKAAHDAGDDVKYLEMVGDHFSVITPDTPIWRATALSITEALR